MLEKLVAVAACCREVRSFGVVMAIMGALSCTAVFRLRKTWDSVSRAVQTSYGELRDFVSSEQNFLNLREATIQSRGHAGRPVRVAGQQHDGGVVARLRVEMDLGHRGPLCLIIGDEGGELRSRCSGP